MNHQLWSKKKLKKKGLGQTLNMRVFAHSFEVLIQHPLVRCLHNMSEM